MTCQHLDGNRCRKCMAAGTCSRCSGSGSVDYYDTAGQCEVCEGTGREKAGIAEKSGQNTPGYRRETGGSK